MTDEVTHVVIPGPPLPETFLGGEKFAVLLAREKKNSLLWDALYKRAKVSGSVVDRAKGIRHPWHLLVLSEDWCGDSINTLPWIERLTEAVPLIDMRIISCDANPDIMDRHLTLSLIHI